MKAYVGVDWSASEIVCGTATEDDEPRRIAGASRHFADVRELIERVKARHPQADEVHVFIEAGAPGWVQMLHHAGAIVHVVDSKQAKAFAKSLGSSGAKDDGRDCITTTWLGLERCERLPIWQPGSSWSTQLTELASMHATRTKERTAELQRLRAYLREHFPELETVLADLDRKWALRLIRAIPTAFHAAQYSREDFDELMHASRARSTTRETVWTALERAEAPWLTESTAQSYAFTIRLMADEVERRSEQLAQIEEKLDEATAGLEVREMLESVGGVGMKMTTRLLELVFDGDLPENRDAAAIKLGASPVFIGSGKTRAGAAKGVVKMRRSVGSRAQSTAYLLGRLASQQLAWAKARYAYDRANAKSAADSYRRIARSLLRIMTAMLRNGESYDDARYVAALQSKGVPWAMEIVMP